MMTFLSLSPCDSSSSVLSVSLGWQTRTDTWGKYLLTASLGPEPGWIIHMSLSSTGRSEHEASVAAGSHERPQTRRRPLDDDECAGSEPRGKQAMKCLWAELQKSPVSFWGAFRSNLRAVIWEHTPLRLHMVLVKARGNRIKEILLETLTIVFAMATATSRHRRNHKSVWN